MFTVIELADGLSLEYAEAGDPTGRPVLVHLGTPGTAGSVTLLDAAARHHGLRLIAVSRPGYGASTLTPPGLASVAGQTLALADLLGIATFRVVGLSGGGPFALATAAAAPARVIRTLVLGGTAGLVDVGEMAPDDPERRALEILVAGDSAAAMTVMVAAGEAEFGPMRELTPAQFGDALSTMLPPTENYFADKPAARAEFEADFRRAIETADGHARDYLSSRGDWDFSLAAVTGPVQLVYGELDQMVPALHGEWLHARLPSSELVVVPGAGHGQVCIGEADRLFPWLAP